MYQSVFSRVTLILDDRDGKFCPAFDGVLKSAGKVPVKLPPRSPNAGCKQECTRRSLMIGEEGVWQAVREYLVHYHQKRPHQGLGNCAPDAGAEPPGSSGAVECQQRLGGMLKSYCRVAA